MFTTNSISCYKNLQIFYSFLSHFQFLCISRDLLISPKLFNLSAYNDLLLLNSVGWLGGCLLTSLGLSHMAAAIWWFA